MNIDPSLYCPKGLHGLKSSLPNPGAESQLLYNSKTFPDYKDLTQQLALYSSNVHELDTELCCCMESRISNFLHQLDMLLLGGSSLVDLKKLILGLTVSIYLGDSQENNIGSKNPSDLYKAPSSGGKKQLYFNGLILFPYCLYFSKVYYFQRLKDESVMTGSFKDLENSKYIRFQLKICADNIFTEDNLSSIGKQSLISFISIDPTLLSSLESGLDKTSSGNSDKLQMFQLRFLKEIIFRGDFLKYSFISIPLIFETESFKIESLPE